MIWKELYTAKEFGDQFVKKIVKYADDRCPPAYEQPTKYQDTEFYWQFEDDTIIGMTSSKDYGYYDDVTIELQYWILVDETKP
jgi:hypothetical protein